MTLAHPRWQVVTDPLQSCISVIAVMPLLAGVALASLIWTPLGYVVALYFVFSFKTVLRSTRAVFVGLAREESSVIAGWTISAIAVAGILLSVPVTAAFLRGDLDAMAAPAQASVESGVDNPIGELPAAIYGPSSGIPDYSICQVVQRFVGIEPTHFCYTGIGYARLWQMPIALTTLISITLLYALFPVAIAWHVRRRPQRTSPLGSRFSKENP
ncbi:MULTISPECIES: hypothetical protein [Rhodococcus]|nr:MULTISPECIES: hypothetical protein [Rhodococcus]NIL74889.1 hypothetical protein [Rhodococcus sp. B10]